MQNSTSQSNNLQNIITDTLTQMANTSLQSLKPLMEGMINNLSSVNKSVKDINLGSISLPNIYKQTCDCCPPEDDCPPHCIASITRVAAQGERILVPFLIKNTCSQTKTFRVGVRELKDQDGNMAPLQPQLNKNSVTLDPGRSEKVSMQIDLDKFENGTAYTAEIVIREKDINQNICFTLTVNNNDNLVCAEPKDEQQYKLRWQSWKSHYYCEPATNQRLPSMKN